MKKLCSFGIFMTLFAYALTGQEISSGPDNLIIEGNNIWIRSEPRTGEVVFTLDQGSICVVLEKGESQTIRGNSDYWYKIQHEGKTGWVFGSQTSLRQNPAEEFTGFFEQFVSVLNKQDEQKIPRLVSPLIGFDYTRLVCRMEGMGVYERVAESHFETTHYPRGTDLLTLMPDFEDFYWISESYQQGKYLRQDIDETTIEVIMDYLTTEDLIIRFTLVEGKWYLEGLKEKVCYESLGT